MRICIVAEHASRRFGGEAILPIHYFERLRARGEDAWLVVHARTREELQAAFPLDRDRLQFIEDAWYHRLLFKFSRILPHRIAESTVSLLSVLITQHHARNIVIGLRDSVGLDIVHQPIPVSPRFPSLLYGLKLPVVIGPMNGGMDYPPAFRRSESILSRLYVLVGRQIAEFANIVFPGKKRAAAVIVANRRTRLALPRCIKAQIVELPENGVDLRMWAPPDKLNRDPANPSNLARFVFVGRLIDLKSLDVVIEALHEVPDAGLEVVGDGPMRKKWEDLASQLGLSSRVSFSGWLPQSECASRLRSARALVFPSICECGGAVVLEAMAAGVAVIATKWGGPADYVNSETGILVEPKSKPALIEGFAAAMRRLIAEPELARAMGLSGRRLVEREFDWEMKLNSMMDIYQHALTAVPQNRQ